MKVILTQDLETLGQKGDVVTVRDGYGRNYLIPRQLAIVASAGNLKRIQEERRQQSRKIEQTRTDAASLKERLDSLEPLTVPVRTGEDNRIFGTITTSQIAELLADQGYQIDRRTISLKEEIRAIGVYRAHIKLHTDYVAELKIEVVPEQQAL